MADIQMCLDDACPSKATCKRNAVSGTPWSTFWQAVGEYNRGDADKCDSYWPYKTNLEGKTK